MSGGAADERELRRLIAAARAAAAGGSVAEGAWKELTRRLDYLIATVPPQRPRP